MPQLARFAKTIQRYGLTVSSLVGKRGVRNGRWCVMRCRALDGRTAHTDTAIVLFNPESYIAKFI